jgi:hypothetical protein
LCRCDSANVGNIAVNIYDIYITVSSASHAKFLSYYIVALIARMDDDDDSSDSDYVPCNAGNQSGDESVGNAGGDDLPAISVSRKRKANDVWKELRAAEEAEVALKMNKALNSTGNNTMLTDGVEGKGVPKDGRESKPPKKKRKKSNKDANSKLSDMMSAVFGYSTKMRRADNDTSKEDESADLSAAVAIAARKVMRSATKVSETKKFSLDKKYCKQILIIQLLS